MVNRGKIRLLHLTLNMEIGGTEQVIKQLVQNLDDQRFDSSILCIDGLVGAMGIELSENGFEVTSLERKPGFDFKLVKDLRKKLKSDSVDILHCHQYTPYVYGVLAAIGTGVPVIFTEHGRLYPEKFKWKRFVSSPLLSYFTKVIIAVSHSTAVAMARYENFPLHKIRVIYNGLAHTDVDVDRNKMCQQLGIDPGVKIVGTISRLDPIKNQPMMIRAFSDVLKVEPEAVLLIVGDGSDRGRLEQIVKELGIQDKVVFTGFKIDPRPYFELLDVFLLSSLSEGTSMTLLETMACAKPSVVTDVGGNPEIVVDGKTGYITKDQDQKGFADALCKLLSNKTVLETQGEAAKNRYLELFTLTKMIEEYERCYVDSRRQL